MCGALCPTCGKWGSVVKVHTVDGQPPAKGSDVIFVSLSCKHAFGREDFNEYNKIANAVKTQAADAIREIEARAADEIGVLFAKFVERRKPGGPKK